MNVLTYRDKTPALYYSEGNLDQMFHPFLSSL